MAMPATQIGINPFSSRFNLLKVFNRINQFLYSILRFGLFVYFEMKCDGLVSQFVLVWGHLLAITYVPHY